jgi:hypothetical protein
MLFSLGATGATWPVSDFEPHSQLAAGRHATPGYKNGRTGGCRSNDRRAGPLCRKYPSCHIFWLTSERAVPLLEGLPEIERVYRYPQDASQVENITFDWVLSLEEDFDLCAWVSRIACGKLSGAYMAPRWASDLHSGFLLLVWHGFAAVPRTRRPAKGE